MELRFVIETPSFAAPVLDFPAWRPLVLMSLDAM
jgi:hypothetical protein